MLRNRIQSVFITEFNSTCFVQNKKRQCQPSVVCSVDSVGKLRVLEYLAYRMRRRKKSFRPGHFLVSLDIRVCQMNKSQQWDKCKHLFLSCHDSDSCGFISIPAQHPLCSVWYGGLVSELLSHIFRAHSETCGRFCWVAKA